MNTSTAQLTDLEKILFHVDAQFIFLERPVPSQLHHPRLQTAPVPILAELSIPVM
jgi:hypothetical protein